AQQAIRLRDDFLSVAGHELKTPLASLLLQIQGLERLARKGALAEDLDRVLDRLRRMVESGERLDRLIRELLDISRVASGHLAIDRAEVDLVALVREVVARHRDDLDGPPSP